jgi:hypothetical protein
MKLRSYFLLVVISLTTRAEPVSSEPHATLHAINSEQLGLSVVQSAVPLKGTNRMNSLAVTLKKIGACDGRVTMRVCFFGRNVSSGKISLNKAHAREGEAVPGAGTTYVFQSDEFAYVPEKTSSKAISNGKNRVVPAKGILPHGSLVQIFAGDRLIATHASSHGFEAVVNADEKAVMKKATKAKRAR